MTEAVEEAVARIAHELRTPLTVIVGYAELLRTRDDERTRVEASRQIQEAAEMLMGRVDSLLAEASGEADS